LSSIGLVVDIVDALGMPHVIFGLGIEVYLQWRIIVADIDLGRADWIITKVMVPRQDYVND
jgi:hypothetical protein